MSGKIKYVAFSLSVIIIVTLVIVFFVNREDGKFGNHKEQKAQKQVQLDSISEQYKMYFNFDGDKTQIIDLIEGKAEFNIVYSGNSKFTAKLLYTDGTFLTILADIYGPYNQRQIIDVPETGAYLLNVETNGEWSLSRK